MKKTVALAVAGLSMLGAAGQASASFETGHMVMVAYNQDTKEIGVDLGLIDFVNGLSAAPTTLATGLDFSAAGAMNTLSLGFFETKSIMTSSLRDIYFATTVPTVSAFSSTYSNGTLFSQNALAIGSNYNIVSGGGNVAVGDPKNLKSYDYLMNVKSGVPGNYSKMNTAISVGEAKLGNGPVDMYLYHFVNTGYTAMVLAESQVVAGQDWVAKLTLDNGTLTAVNSEVPVPATALLFGSSLLGLFGIRRRKNS